MEDRVDEGIMDESVAFITIKQTEEILKQMKQSICKIKGKLIGTGFFCYINYKNKNMPCLMTNYHVLDDNFINQNKKIEISMNDNEINEEILIEEKDILYLSPKNEYDMIIIKMKKEEKYIYYLNLDDKLFNKNPEKGYESIYILHYPIGLNASVSYGKGIKISDNNIDLVHKCNTLNGSSGGPILNLTTNKVIGIHKGFIQKTNKNFNIGTLLKFPLNELNVKKNEISIEVKVNKEDVNKEIYFLNKHGLKEMNNVNTRLYINDEIQNEFKNYFIPKKEGIFSIKLKLNIFVKDCSGMFYECYSITNVDLSFFDSRRVTLTASMFMNCFNLESINLSSFNTRNVINMSQMFYNCCKLKNLSLSSFDTRNVKTLREMFVNCFDLMNIDFRSFDISNVENVSDIFAGCYSDLEIKCTKEFYQKINELIDKVEETKIFVVHKNIKYIVTQNK